MKVAIVGGGAAGFFAAIRVKEQYPLAEVTIFEQSAKVLAKVKISGGGRCNVTNACSNVSNLVKAYPRGGKQLRKMFQEFNNHDAMDWFQSRGVELVVQDDNCVFPRSQDSQTIIDSFLKETSRLNIKIETKCGVDAITQPAKGILLHFNSDTLEAAEFDKVIVTTGGSPKREGLVWLEKLGHKIEQPIPSLFTFNIPNDPVCTLMGIVVENAMIRIPGTKLNSSGPLLITHWGMSGPAVLILSSYGARLLHERNYNFSILVNWVNEINADIVQNELASIIGIHGNKILSNYRPYALPDRLWMFLLDKSGIPSSKRWSELGKKGTNKLVNTLTNDEYSVKGTSVFRDEFVTCGGISLESINCKTMQSKNCPGLYFAGEVLDIDAITGGYNFQAAWTTGYIAGMLK